MTLRRITARASGEAGFALFEVLMSATILLGVALATLTAVDRAQETATQSRGRSVASSLAEQDQERLRAMPATALANYKGETRPVTVGSVRYDVVSSAAWVRDATGGTQSCTSDAPQADYLRVTSTVTSGLVGAKTRPVTLTSLVSPPLDKRGSLAVKVTDSRLPTAPVQGLTVSISGTTGATAGTNASDTTNSAGCAIFSLLPAGTYRVKLNQVGWVDPSGVTAVDVSKGVTSGNVSVLALQYDRAGTITVSFDTLVGGASSPSRGWAATAANSGVPGSGLRSYTGLNAPQASVEIPNLFPFTTGYETYAGACNSANPRVAIPDTNWYTTGGGGAGDSVVVPQGDTSRVATVRQPPLNLTVKNGTTAQSGANVVLTPTDTACTVKPVLTTDATGRATKAPYDFGNGMVNYDPGVPFGRFNLCVDALIGTERKKYTGTVNVLATAGNAALTVNLGAAPAVVVPDTAKCS
jgi:Tfp pilus assembly protein PilV